MREGGREGLREGEGRREGGREGEQAGRAVSWRRARRGGTTSLLYSNTTDDYLSPPPPTMHEIQLINYHHSRHTHHPTHDPSTRHPARGTRHAAPGTRHVAGAYRGADGRRADAKGAVRANEPERDYSQPPPPHHALCKPVAHFMSLISFMSGNKELSTHAPVRCAPTCTRSPTCHVYVRSNWQFAMSCLHVLPLLLPLRLSSNGAL